MFSAGNMSVSQAPASPPPAGLDETMVMNVGDEPIDLGQLAQLGAMLAQGCDGNKKQAPIRVPTSSPFTPKDIAFLQEKNGFGPDVFLATPQPNLICYVENDVGEEDRILKAVIATLKDECRASMKGSPEQIEEKCSAIDTTLAALARSNFTTPGKIAKYIVYGLLGVGALYGGGRLTGLGFAQGARDAEKIKEFVDKLLCKLNPSMCGGGSGVGRRWNSDILTRPSPEDVGKYGRSTNSAPLALFAPPKTLLDGPQLFMSPAHMFTYSAFEMAPGASHYPSDDPVLSSVGKALATTAVLYLGYKVIRTIGAFFACGTQVTGAACAVASASTP